MISKRLFAMGSLVGVLAVLAALAAPATMSAQMRADFALISPVPTATVARCGPLNADPGGAWETMLAAPARELDVARRSLRALEDSLLVAAAEQPQDIEIRYLLAAATGVRAELEGGREQIEAAKDAHAWAKEVLALDPEHPGAKHLLGRLHLEVLRMSRIKRFLATKVLGGGELAGATWEEARALLEAAAVGDPCTSEHHFQLARLYVETGDTELARERLRAVLRMPPASARDSVVLARSGELMDALNGR